MKKIKLIVLLALVSLFAVACNRMTLEEVDAGQTYTYVKDGGFFLDYQGNAVPVSETQGKKIASWYTEPICPFCLALNDEVEPYLRDIQGENTLIKLVPLTFLGSTGVEGEVTYSDYITGVWLSMAENDPELVGQYYDITSKNSFLAELQNSPNQNLLIQQVYTDTLNGQNWEQIMTDRPEFTELAKRMTLFTRSDRDLADKTVNGKVTTPTLLVEGEDKAIDLSNPEGVRPKLEEALK